MCHCHIEPIIKTAYFSRENGSGNRVDVICQCPNVRYEDKDITDLENLISATLHWVGAEHIANSYPDVINN